MGAQLGLPDALRRRGLKVEVVPGWETRSAGSFNPKGAVCHWTAGPANSKARPSLNVVTNGRPGLSGPLCNVYGARDGVAVVVAAGRANHAGTGGWRGLVGNSAVFGTEMEAAGPTDFTDAQRWAYPRINAAYCDLGKFGAEMVCGHSEWATPAGRKTDINAYPMTAMRAQVAALLAGEDDMPLTDDDVRKVALAVWGFATSGQNIQAQDRLTGIDNLLQTVATRQVGYGTRIEDTQARVVALQAALTAATADIEDTVRGALTGVGGVDAGAIAEQVRTAIAAKLAGMKFSVSA